MKFPSQEKKSPVIDPILPLINVVFLLLIFVMMMSRVEGTNDYEVTPPISSSEDPAGQRDSLLILKSDGRTFLNGIEMTGDALQRYANKQRIEENSQLLKIKADASVDAMSLIELMEALRKGGIENLVLLTEKRS